MTTTDGIRADLLTHAHEADQLISELGKRLGADYFTRGEDLLIQRTASGAATVTYGGTLFFNDRTTGEPVACRVDDGEPRYSDVTPDGFGPWLTVEELAVASALANASAN